MACIGFLATEPCGGFHYGRSSHLWQAKFAESLAAMNQARRMSLPLLLVQDGRSKPWNSFFSHQSGQKSCPWVDGTALNLGRKHKKGFAYLLLSSGAITWLVFHSPLPPSQHRADRQAGTPADRHIQGRMNESPAIDFWLLAHVYLSSLVSLTLLAGVFGA